MEIKQFQYSSYIVYPANLNCTTNYDVAKNKSEISN